MQRMKKEEYEKLRGLINQWNVDHYDIFELSQPNEDLEFHGVVRFFFQGAAGANVVTKCIRVASTASTREVISVLIEKFRPDMRMLSQNKYALYEVHVNGEERKLNGEERPLYVQLNWGNDVREGRFLLKNEDHPTVRDPALGFNKSVLQQDQPGFKRKLSKREKKEKKKREREKGKENVNEEDGVANKLYSEAPETSFTRSISNPEAVMRRRRQQKLEKKLAQMNASEGGQDSGGTLKIYGESLRPDVPYKTLFLSTADPASAVVREAMDKYGLEKEDPLDFCLVEVLLPPGGMEYHGQKEGGERVLEDGECPLAIVMQHAKHREQGHIIFQLRQRVADMKKRSKRPRAVSHDDLRKHANDQRDTHLDMLPYLIDLNSRGKPQRHVLPLNVTEVVNAAEVVNNRNDFNGKHFLQLTGADIRPRHCVIAHTEGIVTLTPNSQDAETYVEGQRIYETTMLKHGMAVQFGKDRLYRFLDPRFEEVPLQNQPYQLPHKGRGQPQETDFGVDGRVETVAPGGRPDEREWERQQSRSTSDRSPGSSQGHGMGEQLLPASLEFFMDAEDRVLQASTLQVNNKQLQFKLAPTYTLYMAVRHLLVIARNPSGHEAHVIADFVSKTAKLTLQCIQEQHNDPPALAFWMANSSEILHMFKQDRDIQPLSVESQEMLAEAVQMAFHHLVRCLQGDLQRVMPAFLDRSDDNDQEMGQRYNMGQPTLADVLNTLTAAMTLLRRCRVNAALTIQLFSQLFHFINMWLFNIIVTEGHLRLCTRWWGLRLKMRLGSVEAWAEKQGLELAADCHLCRIIQAAHLLQAPKNTSDDITNISSTCFKLNSLQIRALLTRYVPEDGEAPVSPGFIDRVVSIAENMADELTRTDGREVRLEEDPDLHLPFLLPEDGYSCDTIRSIPNGLPEFLRQLEHAGICRMVVNNSASGSWTVYMGDQNQEKMKSGSPDDELPASPEIVTVTFNKHNGSMGLSIVAAHGEGQSQQGIYIKSVVEGGAAAMDGQLQAGDQLLEVDGKSLVGRTQDEAAALMTKTGQIVELKVAKQGAFYHNLATLLSQPSPNSQRASSKQRLNTDDGPPPPYNGKHVNGYDDERARVAPTNGQRVAPGTDDYRRDHDPRSKSTSNLHVETHMDRNEPQSNLRPAQSVGVLHPSSPGYSQYSPGGRRQDMRPNDYENQPNYPTQDNRPGYNYVDPRQNLPPQKYPQGAYPPSNLQRTSDRNSVSSRASSNSNKDTRPQSMHYDAHNVSQDGSFNSRPRSADVGSKMRDWQDRYDDRNGYPKQNDGGSSPPYSNIGANRDIPPQPQHNPPPKPTAHERLFNQSSGGSGPQKINNNNYSRQPNFFENTPPLQQDSRPAFHQLQRPPSEEFKPRTAPKPAAAPKKNQHAVPPMDIPLMRVDNRQTQPHFYGNNRPSPQGSHPSNIHPSHQPSSMQQRGPTYSNQPEYKNIPPVQDPRLAQQDLRNAPDPRNVLNAQNMRNAPDLRGIPDPRNPPGSDPRNVTDLRNMPDLRNQHDPRNVSAPPQNKSFSSPQQASNLPSPNQTSQGVNRQLKPDPYFHQQHLQQQPYGYRGDPQDLPPPMMNDDMPPDLPPPPQVEDYQDESPPLPPPPAQEAVIEQRLFEEQKKLMEQINQTNQYLATDKRSPRHSPTPQYEQTETRHPGQLPEPGRHASHQQQRYQPPQQLFNSSANRVLPPGVDGSVPLGYQPVNDNSQPNYQNINFALDPRAGPDSQAPPVPQPPSDYEAYDHSALQLQGYEMKNAQPKVRPSRSREGDNSSAWDRDAKEKAEEEEQEELYQLRQQEIDELQARPNLTPNEADKLRKLKMEQEFQRRVREIQEKGDYDYDDDDELTERIFTRERLIHQLKEDLERSRIRIREFDVAQQRTEASREQERLQTLERRLEMYEKDREEQKQRIQRREERRTKEHQQQLKVQRESREKQRQNYEEHKRLLLKEEEKLNQRREEELNKRKQFERERRLELQAQREAEENRLRAEARMEDDQLRQQQQNQDRLNRFDQQRPIRVGEEKRRLDSTTSPTGTSNVAPFANNAQYANVPGQMGSHAPPPPERKSSSYDSVNQYQRQSNPALNKFTGNPKANFAPPPGNSLPSALKNAQESTAPAKKSVSFNTQMNTYKDRTPSQSLTSYKSNSGSQSSNDDIPPPNFTDGEVFDSNEIKSPTESTPPMRRDVTYNTGNTPNVIGAQEIYRDPRSRIEAKIASQSNRGTAGDRMSFRDKMKYFAQEAGEDNVKYKAKKSKTLRDIESQLNGQ